MKYIGKLSIIMLAGFVVGFGLANCDFEGYATGFFAGAGSIATFAWWLEEFADLDDDEPEHNRE